MPILDPLLQLAQLACFSDRLQLGTSVYLLPLRHPVPVAKQVATLDRACGGRSRVEVRGLKLQADDRIGALGLCCDCGRGGEKGDDCCCDKALHV